MTFLVAFSLSQKQFNSCFFIHLFQDLLYAHIKKVSKLIYQFYQPSSKYQNRMSKINFYNRKIKTQASQQHQHISNNSSLSLSQSNASKTLTESSIIKNSYARKQKETHSERSRVKTSMQTYSNVIQQPHRVTLVSSRLKKTNSTINQLRVNFSHEGPQDPPQQFELKQIKARGTFGTVFLAIWTSQNIKVAIKKIQINPHSKTRQLLLLKSLKHSNCIKYLTHYIKLQNNRQYLHIAMQYYPHDLATLIHRKQIHYQLIPVYLFQILNGLAYLKKQGIMHRDIRPDNILVNGQSNRVVICDFGSAKKIVYGDKNISYICARNYRAPQLIFGASRYGQAVDMWSFGCIIIEIVNGVSMFRGRSNFQQMIEVIKILGTPSYEEIKEMNAGFSYQDYEQLPKVKRKQWKDVLITGDALLIDLISKLMVYSPKDRYSPLETLAHPYFARLKIPQVIRQLQTKFTNISHILEQPPSQQSQSPLFKHKRSNSILRTITHSTQYQTNDSQTNKHPQNPPSFDHLTVHSLQHSIKRRLF